MFKKGYTMFITSWENDGDNYCTKQFHVESCNEVEFFLEFLKMFISDSLGNTTDTEVDMDTVLIITNKLLKKYNLKPWEDVDYLNDIVTDLLSCSEYLCFRVYESVEVYYFDKDIYPIYKEIS